MVNGTEVLHGVCVAVLVTSCPLLLPLPDSLGIWAHLVPALTSLHRSHPDAAGEAQEMPGVKPPLVLLPCTNYAGEHYFVLKNWVIVYT